MPAPSSACDHPRRSRHALSSSAKFSTAVETGCSAITASPHTGPELLTIPAGMLNPDGRADVLLNANRGLTAWLPRPRMRHRPSRVGSIQPRDTPSHPDSRYPEGTITDGCQRRAAQAPDARPDHL